MKLRVLNHLFVGTLVVGLGLSLVVYGSALAADAAKPKSSPAKSAAKAAPKPVVKDKLPNLSPAALKKIEAAIPAVATAKPKQPRKVLIFWRCEGFFHGEGIAAGNKAIELLGQKTGAWTTDISRDYEAFEPANLAKYDAVVLNSTTGLKFPDENKKRALLEFVAKGKGIVGVHAATDNFYKPARSCQDDGRAVCRPPLGRWRHLGFPLGRTGRGASCGPSTAKDSSSRTKSTSSKPPIPAPIAACC